MHGNIQLDTARRAIIDNETQQLFETID